MKLYTYSGETPSEALKKAQNAHGNEALIIENKEIRKKTLSQSGLYEVIVAVNEKEVENKKQEVISTNSIQKRLDDIAQRELERKRAQKRLEAIDGELGRNLGNAVRQISELSNQIDEDDIKIDFKRDIRENVQPPMEPQNQNPQSTIEHLNKRSDSKIQSKNKSDNELLGIKQELDKLNDKLKLIQNMVWEEKNSNSDLSIPYEFAEIYRIAKTSGINSSHLDSIMNLTLELMPLKMRENSRTIKRYFREVLRKMIYCRPESNNVTKQIVMLVGPTGVGKTTALAKLAARYSLEKKAKVGIITIDSYRIGALEQLEWYAERMRISIQMVVAPEDFIKALDSLRYCNYILIDTAGRSQHDKEKITQIKKYLQGDYKISNYLVMSATTKYEDLRDIYEAFGILNLDTLIFSKIDESRGLGNIFSLAYETKKPISYFSIGQEVPTDLVVASNEALVDWMLDGFINDKK